MIVSTFEKRNDKNDNSMEGLKCKKEKALNECYPFVFVVFVFLFEIEWK